MFSELWVDPDAEENLKQGREGRDNTIRFLFKMDIQGLGFLDMASAPAPPRRARWAALASWFANWSVSDALVKVLCSTAWTGRGGEPQTGPGGPGQHHPVPL